MSNMPLSISLHYDSSDCPRSHASSRPDKEELSDALSVGQVSSHWVIFLVDDLIEVMRLRIKSHYPTSPSYLSPHWDSARESRHRRPTTGAGASAAASTPHRLSSPTPCPHWKAERPSRSTMIIACKGLHCLLSSFFFSFSDIKHLISRNSWTPN